MNAFALGALVALIAFCSVGAAFAECGNSDVSRAATKTGNVGPCTWYAEDEHCCNFSTAEEEAIKKQVAGGECGEFSQGCSEIIQLLFCGTCSPDQSDWTNKDNIITVCKAFADRIYGVCKRFEHNKAPYQNPPRTKADCVVIGEEYKDGPEFLESLNMDIADDNKDCFNTGSVLVASVTFVATAVFAIV
jgi:hypothetical protein